ncbi:unnamed protein product [Lepidochelys kempii]
MQIYTPHMVRALLDAKGGLWLTQARIARDQAKLLENSEVTLQPCPSLNPATLLPETEEQKHNCLEIIDVQYSSRPDLKDVPLPNADYEWYTDGSSTVIDGQRRAGYAVVTLHDTVEAEGLPAGTSAQLAELIALTRALELSKGKRVNIFTNSKYAFGVLHAHAGREALIQLMGKYFITSGLRPLAAQVQADCLVCQKNNPRPGHPVPPAALEPTLGPGQVWQIDFTEFPRTQGFKYLLVIVDRFSGWPEAFPCHNCTARTVALKFVKELIPRFGLPLWMESDNGTHFTSKIIQSISHALQIPWKLHTPWRPQASGVVERTNQTLKRHLSKVCQEASLRWPDALPLVLLRIRVLPKGRLGLSPFEIMFGRAWPMNGTPVLSGEWELGNVFLSQYMCSLSAVLLSLPRYTKDSQPLPLDSPVHSLQPGDSVLVRTWKDEPLQEKWKGPYTVLLISHTVAKIEGHKNWIHHSRLKAVPAPSSAEQWTVQPADSSSSEISG